MEWSDIIAIIAIIMSSVLAVVEVIQAKKQNKNSLNAYYFNEIYRNHLIKDIPNARNRLSINYEGRIVGYDELIKEMKTIQRDSLYYKYSDKKYFAKLKTAAQNIEDYIARNADKKFEGEEQTDFLNNLYKMIEELYRVINEKYLKY